MKYRTYFFSFFALLVTLYSCSSSKSNLPPDEGLLGYIKQNIEGDQNLYKSLTDKEIHAKKYLQAKHYEKQKKYSMACKDYESLSIDEKFILFEIAFIKALQTCNYSSEVLVSKWEEWKNKISPWLQKEFSTISFQLASKFGLKSYMAYFSNELSKGETVQREKIKLIQRAIHFSKQNKDDFEVYQQRLVDIAPRFAKNITDSNIYDVAYDFEKARFFKKARSLYRIIIQSKKINFDIKKKAWDRLRLSYKKQRDYKQYINQTARMGLFFERLRKLSPKDQKIEDAWVESQITLSRAIWTQHQRTKGKNILLALLKNPIKNQDLLAQIYWVLGSMALEAKKKQEALDYFEKGQELEIKDKDYKERFSWAVGWNYYLMGNKQKASQVFGKQKEKFSEIDAIYSKLSYWQARALRENGEIVSAHKIFEELVENDHFGYYGALAHFEVSKPFTPIEVHRPSPPQIPEFEWLLALDEVEIAKEFLESYISQFKDNDEKLASLPLFERVDLHHKGIFQFFKVDQEEREEALHKYIPFIYPAPYKDTVFKAAETFGISPFLIYSIARQESAFDKHARSWADAFGLMQIIPERAKVLSRRYQISYSDPHDLYEPQTNISMGAALLKELQKKFKNQFISYVGSYNANEMVVKRWKKERFDGDPIKFIEMIPYEETSNYVKLVLRNYFVYRRLEEKQSFLFPSDFFTGALLEYSLEEQKQSGKKKI